MVMARMHLLTVTKTAEHIVQQFLNESLFVFGEFLYTRSTGHVRPFIFHLFSRFTSGNVTLAPTQKNKHYISVFSKEKKRMET